MALPSFVSSRRPPKSPSPTSTSSPPNSTEPLSPATLKRASRTRLIFSLLTSFLFLLTVVFLILVEVGNTSLSHPVVPSIYFLKLDLSHIIPASVPNAVLINSIARTLGLHDFYQVGLWNFCEGYDNSGITGCSKPKAMYWFNPVEIILNELLSGATSKGSPSLTCLDYPNFHNLPDPFPTVALPSSIISALSLVRTASRWMFALFLTGACTSFVSIFLTPLSVYSRWATLPIAIFAFLSALTTTTAAIIATVMFVIFENVIKGVEADVNIVPTLGKEMFAFMWIASGSAILAWVVQIGLCCCCASRRDVKTGRKHGGGKTDVHSNEAVNEKPRARRRWGRKVQ
ncbi:hypothetical protein MMC12_001757 [Toensbergia leucococca]|nr:hypothetical protein [Toensbergia leucococca]